MAAALLCSACRAPLPFLAYEAYGAAEPVPCAQCGALTRAFAFPALLRASPRAAGEALLAAEDASCFYHPGKKAAHACDRCGRFVCHLCEVEMGEQLLCPQCLTSGVAKGSIANLENSRPLYDRLALRFSIAAGLLMLTMLGAGVGVILAPIAFFLALWHRKSPRSLVRPGPWRWRLAMLFSSLEMLAIVVGIGTFVYALNYSFNKANEARIEARQPMRSHDSTP